MFPLRNQNKILHTAIFNFERSVKRQCNQDFLEYTAHTARFSYIISLQIVHLKDAA